MYEIDRLTRDVEECLVLLERIGQSSITTDELNRLTVSVFDSDTVEECLRLIKAAARTTESV